MNIVFAGTPDFAVPALQALLDSAHQVAAVLSQPDRPAGRGRRLTPSPVKCLAQESGVMVFQPENMRGDNGDEIIRFLDGDIDVMVVVAYGLILPERILSAPRLGCINIHPSKLPLWRGPAPIQYSILSGETDTAMTLIQMDKGMDTGDILYQMETQIKDHENAQDLHDRMAVLGAEALLDTLDLLEHERCQPCPQDHDNATYSGKISKQDALIDWHQSAEEIVLRVRAFNSWPVAYTHMNDMRIRVWRAEVLDESVDLPPGTVIAFSKIGLDVATGEGCVRVTECQRPGSTVMSVADFYNSAGDQWVPGESLLV